MKKIVKKVVKRIKHQVIPAEYRPLYQSIASNIYCDFAADTPAIEEGKRPFTKRCVIEIIRDANRIRSYADQLRVSSRDPRASLWSNFRQWLAENEYNPEFSRDMDKAVAETCGLK
jgi:hypothetical protein